MLNGLDYISEKWRTVRHTRKLARIHAVLTVLPMLYVATYAEAQRRDSDYKEMAAALVAISFNLFHLLRTVSGMMQLDAFERWCKDAMECMRGIKGLEREEGKTRFRGLMIVCRKAKEWVCGILQGIDKKITQLQVMKKCKKAREWVRGILRLSSNGSSNESERLDISDILMVNNTVVE